MQNENEKIDKRHGFFILMSFCSYVVLSIPYTIQGSNAPVMMEYYGITASQQGFIMTMQSVGALGAAFFIGLKGEKYNKIHSIAFGLLILCLACGTVGFAPPYLALLLIIIVIGIGVSLIDVMMNGVIPDIYPGKKNTVLPLVHAFYSAGAMLTPVFVTRLADPAVPESFARPYLLTGVVAAVVFALYLAGGRRIMADTPYIDMGAMKKRATENPAEVFKTGRAWFFLSAGILYFTFQFGSIMWLPTYAIEEMGTEFGTGGLLLTAFFAGSLPMRFLGPVLLRRLSPRLIFSLFGGAGAVLMLAALFSGSISAMFVLVPACGFVQGSSVAVFVLMCTEAFPGRTASAASIFSIASCIATMTAPLWIGALSEHTGFRVPMVMISCFLLLSALLIFFFAKPKPAGAGA